MYPSEVVAPTGYTRSGDNRRASFVLRTFADPSLETFLECVFDTPPRALTYVGHTKRHPCYVGGFCYR